MAGRKPAPLALGYTYPSKAFAVLDPLQIGDSHSADESVVEAGRAALHRNLLAVAHNLPQAAKNPDGDIEHVHRLRVSTRRALAALRQFEALTPKRAAKRLAKLLRKIRRAAGRARDLDVLIQRIDGGGAHQQRLLQDLKRRRVSAQRPIERLYQQLHESGKLSRLTARLLDKLGSTTLSNVAYREWVRAKLRESLDSFFRESNRSDLDDLAELHRFRISAKRLRYDLELLTPALSQRGWRRSLTKIERLQELLGDVNDHVVAVNQTCRWLDKEPRKKRRRELKRLRRRERQALHESLTKFTKWWTTARAAKLQAKFAELLE